MRPLGIALSLFLLASSGSISEAATPLFRGTLIFDIGEDPGAGQKYYGDQQTGIVADLNGDGRDDIVVSNTNRPGGATGYGAGNSVSILLGTSAPGPPVLLHTKINVFGAAKILAALDCNGDTKLDLIQARSDTLSVLFGNGAGGFGARIDTPTGHRSPPAVGDLNGDGHPDVTYSSAHGSAASETTWTFLGNGAGSFTPGPVKVGTGTGRLLRDVNLDGRLDLIGGINVTVVTVNLGNGDGTFQPAITSFTSAGVWALDVGDFNSDGKPDLIIGDNASPQVVLLEGVGNGAFTETTSVPIPEDAVWDVAARDMDGDGNWDVVVLPNRLAAATIGQGVNTVRVLFGNGAGGYPDQRVYDGGGSLTDALLGDFDGDGLTDIASPDAYDYIAVSSAAHALSVLRNQGGRAFGGLMHRVVANDPAAEGIADVNRDGNPDLIVASNDARYEVHLGNGSGGFTATINVPTVSSSPGTFAVGDVNRDGTLDLVGTGVNIQYGNGDGTFTAGGPVGSTGVVTSRSLADVNRDGILDLVLWNSSGLKVALGQAGGTFAAATSYSLFNPRSFTVADLNRDGKLDVAAATIGGIAVYLGNGDGTLSTSPTFLEPLRDFYDVTSGDFNRDGAPDLAGREAVPGGSDPGVGGVSVFLGNGSGAFGSRIPAQTFDRSGAEIGSWDVNRDGWPDLVATSMGDLIPDIQPGQNSEFLSARVLLGNGTGEFAKDSDYLVGLAPGLTHFAFGDLNRDGQPDLVGRNVDYVTDTEYDPYVSITFAGAPSFTGSYSSHTETPTGLGPLDLAVADFNRDGKLDVAALASGAGAVNVHLGTGTSSLGAGIPYAVGPFAESIDWGDVNRDGAIDLVIGTSTDLVVLLGNGTGGFAPAVAYTVGSDITGIALGDMNRDGKLDAVIASTGDGSVNISLGNGAGAFGAGAQFPMGIPGQIALGDLDRDGDLDVVTFDLNTGDVALLLGDGAGGLGTASSFSLGSGTRDVVLGDWNRDGYLDLALTRSVGGTGYVTTAVGLGGSFALPVDYAVPSDVRRLTMGDYNLDGIDDLVIGLGSAGTISRMRCLGNGAFAFPVSVTAAGAPSGVAVADLDRDGQPDLVSVNSTGNNISVLLGIDSPPSAVDAAGVPEARVQLSQNRPNPFNPRTAIRFRLARPGHVRLDIFDARGRLVTNLANGELGPGEHERVWTGRDKRGDAAASGVYFYRLEAGEIVETKRMVLLK